MSVMKSISPEILAEGAAWLARLHADDKSPADEGAFRAWLAADPRRVAAFEIVTEVWDVAGAAGGEASKRAAAAPVPTRRRMMFAGAGSLAAFGMGFVVWQRASAGVYETVVGEQKHVVLGDGTQVFLDTDTCIRTSYDNRMRVVAVDRGRCNFHVTGGDLRPFAVDAAAQRISAGTATFDVRRDGNEVCVVLVQGTARVGGRDVAEASRTVLNPGERLVVSGGSARIDKPNLVPLLAWQTGQAVFDNETLFEVVREMNRYSLVKIVAADPAVAGMRISGVYRVGDNVAFAHSIAALLPIALEIDAKQVRLSAGQDAMYRVKI
jgi:transmembrane sensor